jgi:hypothetical protein
VKVATDCLVVYPAGEAHADLQPGFLRPAPRLRVRSFPILILDRADGALIERLNFLQGATPAAVRFAGGGLVVSADGKAWGLVPSK